VTGSGPRPSSALLLAAVASVLTGCGGTGAPDSGSGGVADRARYHGSLDELVDESDVVVTGVATSQVEEGQPDDPGLTWTLTTVRVDSTITSGADDLAGTTIVVRQTGSADRPIEDWPLLVEDDGYLLALSRSDGPGAGPTEYVVTGSPAGVYEATDDVRDGAPVFEAVSSDPGDDLPGDVVPSDLAG
jgi:hypothetical protein